jgi:glycosyltransferase involved in cell wall biosynthesis
MIGFLLQSVSFAKFAAFYVLISNSDIIYSRDEWPLYFLSFFRSNLVFEGHTNRYNFIIKRVLDKSKKIIVITKGLKDFYIKNGVDSEKIFISPDGVDLNQFNITNSKEECRKKLKLPQGKIIITYTGHLYGWKGANILANTAKSFNENELIVFVGGTEKDVENFKKIYGSRKNIIIVGKRPHSEIPFWLKASDVLVIPNTAKNDISKYYTSPMKLFEYMASGVPIVASDLFSIREILNDKNSVLFHPDSPESIVKSIKYILRDKKNASEISQIAFNNVLKYTWDKRVFFIIDFISKKVEK